MSYDQYGAPRGEPYGQQQYPYSDSAEYNPYGAQREVYPSYDQGGYNGYRDEPEGSGAGAEYMDDQEPVHRRMSMATAPQRQPSNATGMGKLTKERTGSYAERDMGFIPPVGRAPRGSIREWRKDYHGDLWTKGGAGSCLCRFFFCTLFTAIFLILSIVLTLALFARPPNIVINSAGLVTNGTSAIQVSTNGLDILLGVNISVSNPNFFGIDLKKIKADVFYPLNGNKTAIGNGSESNIDFHAHSNKTFEFPFTIAYEESLDPNHAILGDIANKCFVSPTDLTVDYELTLEVDIIVIPFSIPISNSVSFKCPLTESDIDNLLKAAGISIGDLVGGAT